MLTASALVRYRFPKSNNCLNYYGSIRYLCAPVQKKPQSVVQKAMQGYENYLEKNWPKVYKIHRLVVDGTKASVADVKSYYSIRRDLSSGKVSLTQLSRPQLQTYIQTHVEYGKIIAIVIFAALPLAFYILAISIILLPRYVLTRHFWTEEQKRKFWIAAMNQTSESHFQPLIQQLPKQAKELQFPLNMKEIKDVNVKPLNELDFKQMNDLSSLDNMSTDELYTQMFIRCLNFDGLSDEEMREVLRNWIKNSADIASNDSLYIYAPVLLQYKKRNANN
uniref:Letm1 RBD domain-containing protein n=1 Tax=Panagrolaimus sp. ES5 TaxID=591445 RepID=A0AC34F6W6_9BILA